MGKQRSLDYVTKAVDDLRANANDLLRGDLSVVEQVRDSLRDLPGVPEVGWWIDPDRD